MRVEQRLRRRSYSSRAAAPYVGSSRICGEPARQLPGGEEEASSRCTGTSSASGTSSSTRPAEERRRGDGRRRATRCADARRSRARRAGASGRAAFCAWTSRSASCSRAVLRVEARRAAPASSRLATTPTAREASSTCTVRLRVRAARSSPRCARGSWSRRRSAAAASSPRRSISCATCTISSSDGVMRPESPIRSAPSLDARCRGSCRTAPSRRGR